MAVLHSKMQIWCSNWEPLSMLLPVLRHVVSFSNGNVTCELSWKFWCWFWHQIAIKSHWNFVSDWPGGYHYNDVIMGTMASQITSLTIVYSAVYSGTNQRKHQSSASLAFVRGIHWVPVNTPHKGPVTRKILPFDDVIMTVSHAHPGYMQDYLTAGIGHLVNS